MVNGVRCAAIVPTFGLKPLLAQPTMPLLKLAQVHIVTSDVPRLARFYEAVLGSPAAGSEEYTAFRTRGATLAICSQRAMDIYAIGAAVPAHNRSIILAFEVDDVDAARRQFRDVIIEPLLEPTTQPWGDRSMLFRDPDGNLITFYAHSDDDHPH
jgi:catechol 2,3-dioxygenase-like lactoylglutathione lyase family enzyme